MIDIVIVNWNSGNYIKKCVDSILLNPDEKNVNRVYVIDNASTDNSIEQLTSNGKITLIKNKENVGFAKACNQGFKLCQSTFVLLLNPDAQLFPGTLEQCMKFMLENKNVDILGCALLNDEGRLTPSCARFPTPARYFFDALGLSKLAPSVFTPALLMTDFDHKTNRKVNQVMGAFMFMHKTIFDKIGYFDERFFVYCEELDFSLRVADAGGVSFYNPAIKAIHSGGGTTNDVKGFRLFLSLRSRLQYSKKHFNYAGYLTVWLCTFAIEPVTRAAFFLLKGNVRDVKEMFKGYKLLIQNYPDN